MDFTWKLALHGMMFAALSATTTAPANSQSAERQAKVMKGGPQGDGKEAGVAKFCPPNCPIPTVDETPSPLATAPVNGQEPKITAGTPRPKLKRCGWVMLVKCVGDAVIAPRGIDPTARASVINISTATRNDLKIIPGISPQAITIITEEHDKGDFSSINDFGQRVCSRISVDLSAVNAEIGGELFRGWDPITPGFKTAGFKCTAGGEGYETDGIKKPWPWYAGGAPIKL